MAGFLRQLWSLLTQERSAIPRTFSLGDRPPFGPPGRKPEPKDDRMSRRIDDNLARLHATFVSPANADLVVREFQLGRGQRAFLAYLEGLTDRHKIGRAHV